MIVDGIYEDWKQLNSHDRVDMLFELYEDLHEEERVAFLRMTGYL